MAFFDSLRKIHVIGAGGIGVSAVARLLKHRGKDVTGSDAAASVVTESVVAAGIPVAFGSDAAHVPADADMVLYSTAVPETHAERKAAREHGIKEMSYPEFLGELTKEYRTVCVSGTNGKSTTTAMLGLILERAGLDPTVIVGSRVASFPDGNLRLGGSDLLVLESCEHQAHFLHYHPNMIVLTNVEEDHLDYYRDIDHIRATFQEYLTRLPEGGTLVMNADDHVSTELRPTTSFTTYGMEKPADFAVRHATVVSGAQRFEVTSPDGETHLFEIGVPGHFNVMNAAAAIAAAFQLGAPVEPIRAALRDYRGIWRRFEKLGEKDGVTVISDYGHHPTAVAGTIAAARDFYPGRRIVLAFQPHHRNRTRQLFDEFVSSFDGADLVLLPEIYDVTGREEAADSHVSSTLLAEAVRERDSRHEISREVVFTGSIPETLAAIESRRRSGDVVLLMGAGDLYKIGAKLV